MIPFGSKSVTLSMLIDLLTSRCRSTQVKLYTGLIPSIDSDLKRCLLFRKCLHWSSLKAVSVPSSFIGGLRGSKRPAILFPFRMATFLPSRTALIADVLRKRPCAIAVGNVIAETGRDLVFGTLARVNVVQCHWQARFDAHLNRLQGHRRQPIYRGAARVGAAPQIVLNTIVSH